MLFLTPKIAALALFIAAYVLFVFFPARRTLISVSAVMLLLLFKAISPNDALMAINWNVIGIFIGTLAVADIFMESRAPAFFAELIVDRAKSTAWAILFICLLTGFISAFVENVATVLIVAPIVIALTKKLKINPIGPMIAVAISSNLQGTATLIGDPPSMLLGGFAKMNFMDFFFYHGKPGIFFAVELGAIFSFFILYLIFKHYKEKSTLLKVEKIKAYFPSFWLVLLIFVLALSSFFDPGFSCVAGTICLFFGLVSLIYKMFTEKKSLGYGITNLDWDTTLFLMAIFILVGSLTITGWIDTFSIFLANVIGQNILGGYLLIVITAVVLSSFIDNVPFLAAMLPVALSVSQRINIDPPLLLFGLLIGASLGGNITPIGASANIVACGILKKEGYQVKFGEFIKIGLPFTLVAVTASCLFVWLIWRP
ncbi:MAG: arsAb [Candidatus Saganbacteria bacterium]|uniref:ArsAb n=1 Tax=Candidatus Saganbacteria bacterium TaxID=2575572 RepID=A0A833L288_UNCSA|nr:MAG: arsAb [Candidatus Saganbacteria bacterium]